LFADHSIVGACVGKFDTVVVVQPDPEDEPCLAIDTPTLRFGQDRMDLVFGEVEECDISRDSIDADGTHSESALYPELDL